MTFGGRLCRRAGSGVTLLAIVACDAKLVLTAPGLDASPADAAAADAPYRLTCTFYHRDLAVTTSFAQTQAIFQTDHPGSQSLDIALGITAKVTLVPALAADVVLTVDLPSSRLTRAFELPDRVRPGFEFVGGEGFSGLNYVATPGSTIDTQFVCEASPSDEARPLPPSFGDASASPVVPPPRPTAPARVRCDVTGSGAALEQSQTITLDATAERTITMGAGGGVHLSWVDGPPPVDPGSGIERTLVLQLYEAGRLDVAHPEAQGWSTQILFQLDPTAALTNPLRGAAGLTGTATLRGDASGDAGAAASVTVGCSAE